MDATREWSSIPGAMDVMRQRTAELLLLLGFGTLNGNPARGNSDSHVELPNNGREPRTKPHPPS